jgi:LacI family transcriptional regulator
MTTALRLGFRVPQDLAFAGFDNSPESRYAFPSLTTADQPFEQIARQAVLMAIGRDEEQVETPRRIILRNPARAPSDRRRPLPPEPLCGRP